jgi:tRNA threonylcarbamoyladenosine biosynthesis protein TsaB
MGRWLHGKVVTWEGGYMGRLRGDGYMGVGYGELVIGSAPLLATASGRGQDIFLRPIASPADGLIMADAATVFLRRPQQMKILSLELSSGQGSIAWLENGHEPFVRIFANDRKHSGLFFESLQHCSHEFGPSDVIVVGLGPGSYAGVRIAIAAAVGLRAAFGAKLAGIPSICAIETTSREYCVIGDARRASFFYGRVSDGRVVEGPALHSRAELEAKIMESSVPLFASEPLPQFPKAMLAHPSARRLAEVAHGHVGEIVNTRSLEPIYLREPHITMPRVPSPTVINR